MPQYITQVTYFRFGTKADQDPPCLGDIRAGAVRMTYQLQNQPQTPVNTGPPLLIQPPPAPEPPVNPAQDPVTILGNQGWTTRPTKEDFVEDEQGNMTGQPAAFGRAGVFENLSMSFEFPFYCRCDRPGGSCQVAKFKFSVEYGGISHPVAKLEKSNVIGCGGNIGGLVPNNAVGGATNDLRNRIPPILPDNDAQQLLPAPNILMMIQAHTDLIGQQQAEIAWSVPIPCICPEDDDQQSGEDAVPEEGGEDAVPEEGGEEGEGQQRSCTMDVKCVYNFRTVFRA